MRDSLVFIEDPDSYRSFLQKFYWVVISGERWPEDKLTLLQSGFEQILFTLDVAWITYEEYLTIQERFKNEEPDGNPFEPAFNDYSLEEYYPHLQENKWPAERFHRFRGRIQLLSQGEIESSHLVFEQLFNYQSQGDWKRHFSLWMEAALDNRSIFSTQSVSPAQIYQHYQLLLKLTEKVWLDDRQDTGLLYHDSMPWYDINNYPVFGTMAFSLNPYREIYGFFHWRSLMDYKTQLNRWTQAVVDPGSQWEEKPVSLLHLLRTFVLTADCLWLIRQLGANYPKAWNKSNTTYGGKHAAIPQEGYKYKLRAEFIKKPENYLPVFFDRYSLNDVCHMFFEVSVAALGDRDFPISTAEEIKAFQEDFLQLLEAAFLIQAMKYPKENKAGSDTK